MPPEISQELKNRKAEITEFLRAMTPLAKPSLDKTKIKIGAAVEHFLSEDFKTEIIETVRSKASEARQVIIVERAESGLIAIEELLIRRIGHLFYPEPSMPGRLFQGDQMEWVHYDAEALRQNPEVRALMDRALKRVGADSIHVRLANLAYGALIGFRQMRKRLGSMFSGHQS